MQNCNFKGARHFKSLFFTMAFCLKFQSHGHDAACFSHGYLNSERLRENRREQPCLLRSATETEQQTFSQLSHNFLTAFSPLSNNFRTTFSQLSLIFLTTFSQLSHNFLTTFCTTFSQPFKTFSFLYALFLII